MHGNSDFSTRIIKQLLFLYTKYPTAPYLKLNQPREINICHALVNHLSEGKKGAAGLSGKKAGYREPRYCFTFNYDCLRRWWARLRPFASRSDIYGLRITAFRRIHLHPETGDFCLGGIGIFPNVRHLRTSNRQHCLPPLATDCAEFAFTLGVHPFKSPSTALPDLPATLRRRAPAR